MFLDNSINGKIVPSYEKSDIISICVLTRQINGPNLSISERNSFVVGTSIDAHKLVFTFH